MRINEVVIEESVRYILYLDHKPAAFYSSQKEAEFYKQVMQNKVPNAHVEIKKEVCTTSDILESLNQCPHCGGEIVSLDQINEKKDACYYKVKSRYKIWPSAYASGALVRCRKVGAKNWGKGKK